MSDQTHEAVRRRIMRRLPRTIAELQSFIDTVQWWNNNRLDAPPMDCESEMVLLISAKRALAYAKSDIAIPAEYLRALGNYIRDTEASA
jgi:hypothetical protein